MIITIRIIMIINNNDAILCMYVYIYGNFSGDKDIEIRLVLRTLFLEGF